MPKSPITKEQMSEILNICYKKAIEGIPGSKSSEELATEYLNKYHNPEIAIKKMVEQQIIKCTTSGFITSLGGLITFPVAIPANLASVLYIQLRMITAIAIIGGNAVLDDEVQTLSYICLVGTSVSDIFKKTGVQFVNKLTKNMIMKIPSTVFIKINQKMAFRLITKAGEKGVINLAKMVPIAGGIVGGSIDFIGTKIIAKKAYKTFILNDYE